MDTSRRSVEHFGNTAVRRSSTSSANLIYPPTPAADSIIVNPIYPPEYKDFILVFPADSGIKPLYIVFSLRFDAARYHGKTDTPVKSKGPENGQDALDNSVQVKPTSERRIGIDPKTNEFVVFDHTGGDDYHGHVRAWNKLHQDMKNVLIKAKKPTPRETSWELNSESYLPRSVD